MCSLALHPRLGFRINAYKKKHLSDPDAFARRLGFRMHAPRKKHSGPGSPGRGPQNVCFCFVTGAWAGAGAAGIPAYEKTAYKENIPGSIRKNICRFWTVCILQDFVCMRNAELHIKFASPNILMYVFLMDSWIQIRQDFHGNQMMLCKVGGTLCDSVLHITPVASVGPARRRRANRLQDRIPAKSQRRLP